MTIVAEDRPDVRTPSVLPSAHAVVGVSTPEGDGSVFARRHLAVWEQAISDWTQYLRDRRRAKTTIYQRRWQLRKLSEAFGHRSPWKLATSDLESWLGQPTWDKEAAKSARAGVRGFYAWAVKHGRTKRNPAAELESITVGRGVPRPTRESLVAEVLNRADARIRLMVTLAYWGGLRACEIATLRWSDIDGDRLIIKGKGDRERVVPLHAKLDAELRRWRDGGALAYRYSEHSDVWVFPGQAGRAGLHPRYVSQMLSAALGDGCTGHQLRHGFAQRVLDRTGDLATTQDLMGHASPATTRIYAGPTDRAKRAAIDLL